MQMMYEIIAQELKSMNMEGVHPQDYLNFYCLGNRELVSENNDISSDNQPEKSGPAVILNYFYWNFSKFLLFCSYICKRSYCYFFYYFFCNKNGTKWIKLADYFSGGFNRNNFKIGNYVLANDIYSRKMSIYVISNNVILHSCMCTLK